MKQPNSYELFLLETRNMKQIRLWITLLRQNTKQNITNHVWENGLCITIKPVVLYPFENILTQLLKT